MGRAGDNVKSEPRWKEEYSERQVEAARRVLVDIGQILASFKDCIVLVGGWIPDLLIPESEEPHVGSIDVDFALDAAKLNSKRYAELLNLLLDTRRYRRGEKDFQLVVDVDLGDGEPAVQVQVEFMAPTGVNMKKHKPRLVPGFRVLQTDGCGVAFNAPVEKEIKGKDVLGAENTVRMEVVSMSDFLVMKSLAIGGRDKPKDSYDLCYCLDHSPNGFSSVAADWKSRLKDSNVSKAVSILEEKFSTVDSFGPSRVVEFHNSSAPEERDRQARRAFELVSRFLELIEL